MHQGLHCNFNDLILPDGRKFNPNEMPVVSDGDKFVLCDFVRYYLNTKIFEGRKDLVFYMCNLDAVDVDSTWTLIESPNWANDYLFELAPDQEVLPQ